jgi:GAF domain-containing protein
MLNPRALIVDRDANQQALLASVLKQDGFRVDSARGVTEAILLLGRSVFALLVLDPHTEGAADLLARISPDSSASVLVKVGPGDTSFDGRFPVIRRPVDIAELRAAAEKCRASAIQLAFSDPAVLGRSFAERSLAAGARSGIALTLVSSAHLDLATCFGYPPGTIEGFLPISIGERYPICSAVRMRQPVWLSSLSEAASEYPLLVPLWNAHGTRSLAAVPVVVDSRVIGVVGWSFAEEQAFDARQRDELLEIVSDLGRSLIAMQARYLDVG